MVAMFKVSTTRPFNTQIMPLSRKSNHPRGSFWTAEQVFGAGLGAITLQGVGQNSLETRNWSIHFHQRTHFDPRGHLKWPRGQMKPVFCFGLPGLSCNVIPGKVFSNPEDIGQNGVKTPYFALKMAFLWNLP